MYNLIYENETGASVELHGESAFDKGIVVSSKTGFSENSVDIALSQGINQVGASVQGMSVQHKPITIDGVIIDDVVDNKERLLEVILPAVNGRLIYSNPDAIRPGMDNEWFINVSPVKTPVIEPTTDIAQYLIQLTAPYPYWLSMTERAWHISGLTPLFRFPWNISEPFKFSERLTSVFANVINTGTVPVTFTVRFRALASVTNPSIIKVDTREFIKINKKLEIGEVITAEMTPDRVSVFGTKGGVTQSYEKYLDIDSVFFLLDAGDNVLKYDAEIGAANLDTHVFTRAAIVGVW